MFLSNELMRGLGVNAIYDLVKSAILRVWKQVDGKTYHKYRPSGVEEIEASFDFKVRAEGEVNVSFKLKGGLSDELKCKCIENAFDLIRQGVFAEEKQSYICRITNEEGWEINKELEYINKYIKPKNN